MRGPDERTVTIGQEIVLIGRLTNQEKSIECRPSILARPTSPLLGGGSQNDHLGEDFWQSKVRLLMSYVRGKLGRNKVG